MDLCVLVCVSDLEEDVNRSAIAERIAAAVTAAFPYNDVTYDLDCAE